MKNNVSIIFNEPPLQWGLRGDPFLWDELKTHFSAMLLPCQEECFLKEFYAAFEHLTGNSFDSEEPIFVPRYNHGGMSSGLVSSKFWLEKVLPLLIERLRKENSIKK